MWGRAIQRPDLAGGRSRRVAERREREGVEFFHRHRAALSRAQAETGVPAEIIVAIIGVETYYGGNIGKTPVLDALATIAFDYPRRSRYFTSELEQFLLVALEPDVAAAGNVAGAGELAPGEAGQGVIGHRDSPAEVRQRA